MTALSQLVGWVLAGFYAVVPNYAVAIILLGLTFMTMVVPLTLKSTRSMLAMQKLQPKMKQLQQQHKNDRLALNQALTQLYKEEGVSPFGSCLPTLLPLPLFYVLYRVITGLGHKACIDSGKVCHADPLYINHKTKMYHDLIHNAPATGAHIHAFGIDLATSAWTAINKHLGAGEIFGSLLLLLIMIAANYYQQVQITNLNPMVRQNQQANPQMQIMRFFPIVFGLICIRLPSGLVLYYAVSAMFRVGQQWLMYRYDPKVKALVARDDRDIDVLDARLDEKERKPQKASTSTAIDATAKPRNAVKAIPARTNPSKPSPSARAGSAARSGSANNGGPLNGKQPGRYAGSSGGSQRNRNRRRRGK